MYTDDGSVLNKCSKCGEDFCTLKPLLSHFSSKHENLSCEVCGKSFTKKSSLDWHIKARSNTPGTAGGPGGRDRTLALKSRKTQKNNLFFVKKYKLFLFCIYLLFMPKYWGKNYCAHGSFPEVDQKQKTEKKERKRERETERW